MSITRAPRRSLTTLGDLAEAGLLPNADDRRLEEVIEDFRLAITPTLTELIDRADENDPIGAQFVPTTQELVHYPGEASDPIGDDIFEVVKGVTHRYPDRALLKLTHVCRVYCRFCFRREKVGNTEHQLSDEELSRAIQYLQNKKEVWEVILTGGDPLVLSNRRLSNVMRALESIDHIEIIRFHTRVPIASPDRIDAGLLATMKTKKAVYVVVHCNHPRELTSDVCAGIAKLVDAGIPVLSQSVLLRGVNDTPETLTQLMRKLVANRIKPYYLHHPDLALGTGHFRVSIRRGMNLLRSLRGVISGLCQPTYVLDIPGGHGKSPLTPSYLSGSEPNYEVTDYRGSTHAYTDNLIADQDPKRPRSLETHRE